MPIIEPQTFIGRKWVEHYSGFPKDLFYSGTNAAEPYTVKPHLHLNYSMGGELQSLTYKDDAGTNHQLFLRGVWNQNPVGIPSQAILAEIEFIRQLT